MFRGVSLEFAAPEPAQEIHREIIQRIDGRISQSDGVEQDRRAIPMSALRMVSLGVLLP